MAVRFPGFVDRMIFFNTVAPMVADQPEWYAERGLSMVALEDGPTGDYRIRQGRDWKELLADLDTPARRNRYIRDFYEHRLLASEGSFEEEDFDFMVEPFEDPKKLAASWAPYQLQYDRPMSEPPLIMQTIEVPQGSTYAVDMTLMESIDFADDYAKVSKQTTAGVSSRMRLLLGFIIAGSAAYWAAQFHPAELQNQLALPVFKNTLINLGYLFVPFSIIVIVGAANAVNLTDGLDGLAIMPVMIAAGALGVIAYAVGRVDFTEYLDVHYVPGTGELLIFSAGLIGGGLGFLWYNAPPAAVFMGDTGSLALGGALGAIAVATKHEIVLAIVGGVFVVEALSVIIQVAYFKRTGKRVFLMAPIHHHFEKRGWAEPQIVIRFWIISLILALIGLATLKVR